MFIYYILLGSILDINGLEPVQIPQDHVVPIIGCGTGCRIETEQTTLPEIMDDGWIRLNVIQETWINRCQWENTHMNTGHCWDEAASGMAEPPVQHLWLFADCPGERFATSKNLIGRVVGTRCISRGRELKGT